MTSLPTTSGSLPLSGADFRGLPVDPRTIHFGPTRTDRSARFDARQLWAILLHRAPLGLLFMALTMVLAILVGMSVKPTYQSTAAVMVEPRENKVVNTDPSQASLPADVGAVDTQVEILKTPTVAERVVRRLSLYRDPEFNPRAPRGAAAAHYTPTPLVMNQVVQAVGSHLDVRRLGLTYVIDVSFRSHSATKAALIANAFVQEYLAQQMQGKINATREANGWLNQGLDKLRADSQAADAQVQNYIVAHNLMGAEGQTSAEQSLTQLNQQLAQAQADAAEKQGRLNAAMAQLAHGGGDDVGAALGSETIRDLRKAEAEESRQVADLSVTFGPKYPDLLRAKTKLADIQHQIRSEITRILSSLRADVTAARQREGSLRSSLGAARGGVASNSRAQIDLIGLKQRAEAARKVYDAYLSRADQLAADDGVKLPDARMASPAIATIKPISPKMSLVAAAAIVLGLIAGLLSMLIAEVWFRSMRTRTDVENKLDAPFAGNIPDPEKLKLGRKSKGAAPADYIVEQPFSGYSEAFRTLRAMLYSAGSGDHSPRMIAITSALPREGKSTTALCLARALAINGARVLLVDCDARRSGLNEMVGAPERGLADVLAGKVKPSSVIIPDPMSRALILPWGKAGSPRDLISTPQLDAALETFRQEFDYVLIDTAPVLAAADTRVLAAKADVALMIVEWNKTPVRAAVAAIEQLRAAGVEVMGVALNKVNTRLQSHYGYGDSPYDYKAVASYYGH